MLVNKNIKRIIAIFVMIILWGIYLFQAYSLFSEVVEFTTPGSSYIVQLLEFTNYRASNLSFLLIEYFILISITSTLQIYHYVNSDIDNRKKELSIIVISYILILILLLIVTNIFFIVYLLLTILAILIIISSFYIANLIWGSSINFDKGDILITSSSFISYEEANNSFTSVFKALEKNYPKLIEGRVYDIDGQFYFEIYTLSKMTLKNKGDLTIYENI